MKEKTSNRRPVLIIILIFSAVFLVGLTAAAVYASRFVGQGIESFLSQGFEAPVDLPGTIFEDNPASSIYDQGVLVVGVEPGSPAAAAGIRRGTIILSVNGDAANDIESLQKLLANAGSGSTVTLSVLNSPKPEEISVTLAEEPPLLGVSIDAGGRQLSFGSGNDFGLPNGGENFEFNPDNLPFNDPGFEHGAMIPGIVIGEVVEGSAAEFSGLLVGDIIESIDGGALTDVESLISALSAKSPGDTIKLGIQRENESQDIVVTLGAHPDDDSVGFLGIKPANMMFGQGMLRGNDGSGQFAMPFHLPNDENMISSGALIVAVAPDSPAITAGLEKGDVVTGIDAQTIDNVDDLIQAVSSKEPGDSITISILRNDETIELPVTLGENPDAPEKAYLGVELGAFYNLNFDKSQDGTLPEDFSFHMNPDFNWEEFFANPEDFSDFFPHFNDKMAPNVEEQDA